MLSKAGDASNSLNKKEIEVSSFLLWEEHCVECSAPQCYASCSLYSARRDGDCARFSYGIYPNRKFSGLFNYGADIRFKRWAKLEAVWPEKPAMRSVKEVRRIDTILRFHGVVHNVIMRFLPAGTTLFRRANNLMNMIKVLWLKKMTASAIQCGKTPDALYIKIFSPEPEPCDLQVELVQDVTVYRNNIRVVPGWNEYTVPFENFDFESGEERFLRFWVNRDQEVNLIFTWLDLVKFKATASSVQQIPAEKVKCVAWDLDNTLWQGVIGDDGKEGVTVVSEAVDLIHKLDQRGIIQTIVSKNEHDTAWEKIVELALDEYFLYPAINWDPKSVNISRIAKELNININSFALIDDSEFECGEVSTAYPQVRVYNPEAMPFLLNHDEFDVPVTKETGKRRLKYMEEVKRKSVQQAWAGDRDEFLSDCNIKLNIKSVLNQNQKERCLELLQRSNQFNLAAKRYTSDEFEALLSDSEYDSYAFDVHDKYGNYGIVGFVSILKKSDAVVVTDFVMSCRVARKKIENAFFHWYVNRKECCGKNVYARMKVTGRNQPLRQVFDEMMFKVLEETDSEIMLRVDAAEVGGRKPPISTSAVV